MSGLAAENLGVCASVEAREKSMREYQGYLIKENPETGRWEIFWREKKLEVDFAREVEAEDWIDDLVPSHRF